MVVLRDRVDLLSSRLALQQGLDSIGRTDHGLVLPHPEYRPSETRQVQIGLAVPLHVAAQLRRPPGRVGRRVCAVGGARVPEAPVYEDGHLRPRERDVRATPTHARQGILHPVAEAASVQLPTQCQFRCRVATRLA